MVNIPKIRSRDHKFQPVKQNKIYQLPKLEFLELKGFKSWRWREGQHYATEIVGGVYLHTLTLSFWAQEKGIHNEKPVPLHDMLTTEGTNISASQTKMFDISKFQHFHFLQLIILYIKKAYNKYLSAGISTEKLRIISQFNINYIPVLLLIFICLISPIKFQDS